MDISNAKAVITGGASGLGEATARHFRACGAQVTIFDRAAERGRDVAAEIGASFAQVDVTDEASVQAGLDAATEAMGGLNVLVNCAGIGTAMKTLGREGPHPLELFQQTIGINLIGTYNCLRLAAAMMAENEPDAEGERGAIVNTASIAAFDGQKGQAAYTASKAGVAGMALPVARDLAQNGIRVNTIAPGIFLTPMLMGLPEAAREQLAADVTFPKRLGRPEEYAKLAKFMIEAGYLNAEVIRLDGALRMQ